MGWLARTMSDALNLRALPTSSPSNPDQWLLSLLGAEATSSGIDVDEDQAMRLTAVWAAVTLLADILAGLPLQVFRRRPDGGKDLQTGHPVYRVVHDQPNPETVAYTWTEASVGHHLLWGNCYSHVQTDRAGRVQALWQLLPQYMTPKRPAAGAPLEYHYDDGTTKRVYAAEEILHVPGFGFNGLVGLSRIRYAAEALGEGVAQERFAASWYAGGGTPRILLRHPRTLSPKAKANLARAWSEAYSGHQAYHEPAILEEGTEVENLTMPFEDMQLLETRRFKVTDIARLYRVPPHMLAETDKSTSWGSGIEAQTRGLKVFAAGPIGSRFEQVMTARLLTKAEQAAGFFIAFNFDAMSRADLEARYRAYSIGRQNGWLSSNDVRRRENLDPIDDPSADLYWQPLNMVPMSSPAAMGTEPRHQVEAAELLEVRTGAAAPRLALRDRFEPIVRERFDEVVRREVADIGRASSKINSRSVADFSKWLRDFYRDHRAYVDGKLRGVLTTLAELAGELAAAEAGGELSPAALERSIDEYIVARVDRWTEARHNVLLADIREAQRTNSDPLAAITDRLEQWTETSAATEANRETIAVTEAAGRAAWAALGITTMVWRLNGDSCPICRGLEGRTVSIHRAFLDAGVAHEFEGRPPFRPNRAVRGAPAHPGCKCYTAPVME